MSVSTGEIAERMRRPDMPASRIAERVKFWTRCGLLHPIGGQGSGSGRHHAFEELTLVDVAVLSALADAEMGIRGVEALPLALALARPAFEKWDARDRQGTVFLEIAFSRRGKSVAELHEDAVTISRGAAVSIIISLNEAWARLPRGLVREQEIADRVEARLDLRAGKSQSASRGRTPKPTARAPAKISAKGRGKRK